VEHWGATWVVVLQLLPAVLDGCDVSFEMVKAQSLMRPSFF